MFFELTVATLVLVRAADVRVLAALQARRQGSLHVGARGMAGFDRQAAAVSSAVDGEGVHQRAGDCKHDLCNLHYQHQWTLRDL